MSAVEYTLETAQAAVDAGLWFSFTDADGNRIELRSGIEYTGYPYILVAPPTYRDRVHGPDLPTFADLWAKFNELREDRPIQVWQMMNRTEVVIGQMRQPPRIDHITIKPKEG